MRHFLASTFFSSDAERRATTLCQWARRTCRAVGGITSLAAANSCTATTQCVYASLDPLASWKEAALPYPDGDLEGFYHTLGDCSNPPQGVLNCKHRHTGRSI